MPNEPWNHLEIRAARGEDGAADAGGEGGRGAVAGLDQHELRRCWRRRCSSGRTGRSTPSMSSPAPMTGREAALHERGAGDADRRILGVLRASGGGAGGNCAAAVSGSSAEQSRRTIQVAGPAGRFYRGRYPADERTTMVAGPGGGIRAASGKDRHCCERRGRAVAGMLQLRRTCRLCTYYPGGFPRAAGMQSTGRRILGQHRCGAGRHCHRSAGAEYEADARRVIPMNIEVKDPLWPMRDMLDFTFSVKPGEPHTLWLDTRDRILPNDKSIYIHDRVGERGVQCRRRWRARRCG